MGTEFFITRIEHNVDFMSLVISLNDFSGLKMWFKIAHKNVQARLMGQVLQNIQVLSSLVAFGSVGFN